MKIHRLRFVGILSAATFLWAAAADADFVAGFRNYQKGNFAEAHTQFLDLAELGDGASQFNLGAMSLRGEGVPRDPGTGLGWIRSAAQNGYTGMPEEKISAMEGKLTPEQKQAADAIVARYGIEALRKSVLPTAGIIRCIQPATRPLTVAIATPVYPLSLAHNRQDGAVIIETRVGVDGLASDPQVVSAVPPRAFNSSALQAVLRSRFKPATLNGVPVAARRAVRISYFIKEGGVLWNVDGIKKLRAMADEGEPQSRFLLGLYASLDSSLKIPEAEAQRLLLSSAQAGHPGAQFWIARELQQNSLCSGNDKAQPWLERAANSRLAPAMTVYVLNQSQTRDTAQLERVGKMIRELAEADDAYSLKHATALLSQPPAPSIGDATLALQAAKSLAKLDSPDPQATEAIAAAYAANGDFKRAADLQEEAVAAADQLYWNTSLMEERLAAYDAGNVWQGDLFELPPSTETIPDVNHPLKPLCKTGQKKRCGRAPDRKTTPTGSFIPR